VTELESVIAQEIRQQGPMLFSRFMELALYYPQLGYYCQRHDPFGTAGDFYTAEQLQPVFGRLIAAYLRQLAGDGTTVLEIGAGRGEMAEELTGFHYIPVDISTGGTQVPQTDTGIVFTNELFDAIPVDLLARVGESIRERRVALMGERFVWDDTRPSDERIDERVTILETQQHRAAMLARIAASLGSGYIVIIDYGYTQRELVRFPEGTLMSYHRHTAVDDVLLRPGEQDITAHVDWTALQDHGARLGLSTLRFESLASALLRAGEADGFATALSANDAATETRHRMQLKSLLFGMGETFQVLVQRKG
jgi:SAM-dependent MidA family methyltransferase